MEEGPIYEAIVSRSIVSETITRRCAMLCSAVLYCAMLCYYAVLCYARAILRDVRLRSAFATLKSKVLLTDLAAVKLRP